MALKCVYLDMDGVLADLCDGIARAVGVETTPFYGPLNTHWRGVADVLTHLTEEEWSEARLLEMFKEIGHDFWVGLRKYPWADELFAMCESFAPTVIMTSPADIPSAASGKMEWLHANYPQAKRYAITSCKHHLSHPDSVLIDDSVEFCEEFVKHGGNAYLFPQPWSDPDGWAARDALAEIRELLERVSAS